MSEDAIDGFRPALGKRGGPAPWDAAEPGAPVALHQTGFADERWSFLYDQEDTSYAAAEPVPGLVAEANRRMREAPAPQVHGPFIKPPVWTWEVPAYFWVGGIASGAAFMAAACDVAGDHDSAVIARRIALGAVTLAPPLLIADLGRPARFLNMMRIIKPRSPMSTGAWCLVAFSGTAAGGVTADLAGLRVVGRALGAATAVLGGYLGSYTGVLLAATSVPLWGRSRLVLPPIFVCTATASGAAATRLTLVARGMGQSHPTQRALGVIETVSILTELVLSQVNHRRLGPVGEPLRRGRAGVFFRAAEAAVTAGVATRLVARRAPRTRDLASTLFLLGALGFRLAWVEAGKDSAVDHEVVAAACRAGVPKAGEVPREPRRPSAWRRPTPLARAGRLWTETVRRTSLLAERVVRR